jgi:hypothetical protein
MNCRGCVHAKRAEIDQAIIAGTAYRIISQTYGLSLGAISRHKEHVKQTLGEAIQRRDGERQERGSHLLERVERLVGEAEGILVCAKSSQDWKGATAALGAAARLLELLGRLSGELVNQNAPGVHLTLNRVTTTINNYGSDEELAQLVMEATNNFSTDTIEHFRALTTGQPTEDHQRP